MVRNPQRIEPGLLGKPGLLHQVRRVASSDDRKYPIFIGRPRAVSAPGAGGQRCWPYVPINDGGETSQADNHVHPDSTGTAPRSLLRPCLCGRARLGVPGTATETGWRTGAMMPKGPRPTVKDKNPRPTVKDKNLYERLRDEGNSKQKAARIANEG
jgi:hypothetical protein